MYIYLLLIHIWNLSIYLFIYLHKTYICFHCVSLIYSIYKLDTQIYLSINQKHSIQKFKNTLCILIPHHSIHKIHPHIHLPITLNVLPSHLNICHANMPFFFVFPLDSSRRGSCYVDGRYYPSETAIPRDHPCHYCICYQSQVRLWICG